MRFRQNVSGVLAIVRHAQCQRDANGDIPLTKSGVCRRESNRREAVMHLWYDVRAVRCATDGGKKGALWEPDEDAWDQSRGALGRISILRDGNGLPLSFGLTACQTEAAGEQLLDKYTASASAGPRTGRRQLYRAD